VKLGQHVGGVADAREAIRLGPRTALTFYNAARVFAQAAEAVERDTEQPAPRREQTAVSYRDEASERLEEALRLLPDDEERARFWQKYVRSDGALANPLRRSPRFLALAQQYERPAQ
jgi:hypothetical protein